jgi:hypothetical protein
MLKLLKNISGALTETITNEVILTKSVDGSLQQEDYINLYGLNCYLQNFTRIQTTVSLRNPLIHGLKNKNNIPVKTLEIDY